MFSPQRSTARRLFILPILILGVYRFCLAGWNARCGSKKKKKQDIYKKKNNHMQCAVAWILQLKHSAVHPGGKKCEKK